ncbi:hypothetical protein JW756_00170 [Candidatus Woesearchaeota archaeon]|nr:hypothetical protein [Candidatus Woesearchaeota archaeon]
MEWYKKLGCAAFGVGLTLLAQVGYRSFTGPDLVYRHRHFGDPSQHGQAIIDVRGAKFNEHSFAGGAEGPKDVEAMVDEALSYFKDWNLLEQAGIGSNQPVREVRIEIKK